MASRKKRRDSKARVPRGQSGVDAILSSIRRMRDPNPLISIKLAAKRRKKR